MDFFCCQFDILFLSLMGEMQENGEKFAIFKLAYNESSQSDSNN